MTRRGPGTRADVVVVGAGSAGCAAAATLIGAGLCVTLVEAGPSTLTGAVERPDAHNCDQTGRLDWRYTAATQGGRRVAVPRGRVLGGCSVVNTCVAVRPDPPSFDRWSELVGGGWAWSDVVDDFRAVERDVDHGDSPDHGADGPLPVVRWRSDELEAPSAAFVAGCVAAGHAVVDDLNAPGATGVGSIPMNRTGTERASSDLAFVAPALAASDGRLRIVTGHVTDRLLLEGRRVRGVVTVGPDGPVRHLADHTVLSAGSFGTPAILQRSGLGPAALLRPLGIDVVEDLPVGDGLHDHPLVPLVVSCPPAHPNRPAMQVILKATTPGSPVRNDVQLTVFNRVELATFGLQDLTADSDVAMLCVSLQHSEQRGRVRITGSDPDAPPDIELAHLAHPDDRRRVRLGVRELVAIAATAPMRILRSLEAVDVTTIGDRDLDALLAGRVRTTHHPMGTAAMAAPERPGVVGPDLRVRGVDGLSVADASVIPRSLNANIHTTCTMIGVRHGRELAATTRR